MEFCSNGKEVPGNDFGKVIKIDFTLIITIISIRRMS